MERRGVQCAAGSYEFQGFCLPCPRSRRIVPRFFLSNQAPSGIWASLDVNRLRIPIETTIINRYPGMDDSLTPATRHTQQDAQHATANWRIEDIPFDALAPAALRDNADLFYLLTAASFVEITSDLYTQNLVEYFAHDPPVAEWLRGTWEPQEVQHGVALRRYIAGVWPEFDWRDAYARFYAEYSRHCRVELLAPTHTLELVARCVVETGTASLYTMIQALSPEPVLRVLARRIRDDEIHHYRYFYHAFLRYRTCEPAGRRDVARVLFRRLRLIDNEDAYLSFKHAYLARHPRETDTRRMYKSFQKRWVQLARRHYPYEMAAKMFLKPLALNPRLRRATVPLLAAGARYLRS
jgi:hypothetical protein